MKVTTLSAVTILLCISTISLAQRTVKGTVTGVNDGNLLAGVNVVVKGTLNGTTTDVNGKYSLEVNNEANSLLFSFVGYEPKEVSMYPYTQVHLGYSQLIMIKSRVEYSGNDLLPPPC